MRLKRDVLIMVSLALALASACRAEPAYDFGSIDVAQGPEPSTERPLVVSRFVSRLYADVLGRRPASLDVTLDCDAIERVAPGFRDATCGGLASITFPIDERQVLENALSAVAEPSALWPHLVSVFVAGSYAQVPRPTEWQGKDGELVDHLFARYLDRAPTPYERVELVTALQGDPAMTPRALLIGILSSEEYRRR